MIHMKRLTHMRLLFNQSLSHCHSSILHIQYIVIKSIISFYLVKKKSISFLSYYLFYFFKESYYFFYQLMANKYFIFLRKNKYFLWNQQKNKPTHNHFVAKNYVALNSLSHQANFWTIVMKFFSSMAGIYLEKFFFPSQ